MSSTTPSVLEASDAPGADQITPIGVDVGERTLAAVAPQGASVEDARLIDGEPARESHRLLKWLTEYLQDRPGDTTSAETAVFAAFWRRLRGQLHSAAARVIQDAEAVPGAVLVLEELAYPRSPLWHHRTTREPGTWLLPAFQEILVERATDAALPVAWVAPEGTSVECHACRERGERLREDWGTFRCQNPDCSVGDVDVDASAALSIAKRVAGHSRD